MTTHDHETERLVELFELACYDLGRFPMGALQDDAVKRRDASKEALRERMRILSAPPTVNVHIDSVDPRRSP